MVIFKGENHMLTKAEIEKYFLAEKQESLIFLIVGIIAISLALIFYFASKTAFLKGSALPLLLIGLIQAVAGYAVYARSDDQRVSQVYAYDMNPDQLKTTELTRMRKVNTNFLIYRSVEIGAVIAGIVLIALFHGENKNHFWYGFGLALTLMATVLFFADFIAEKRAVKYTRMLEEFNMKK